MHSADHYHLVGQGAGLAGQGKRVADNIGDVLDVAVGVIMGHNGRVALLLEAADIGNQCLSVFFHLRS